MSWVHGSVNPIVGGGLRGLPWTDGNGGWHGSLEELGARCSRMWELNVVGVCVCVCVCVRERDSDGAVLMGGEGRWRGVRIELTMVGNVGGRCTSLGAVYRRGGEIGRFWVR
jgi:hypothetical protein